eukprot:COSAG01_NODE_64120_length_277_cov_1.719101_1_plen_63_part_01
MVGGQIAPVSGDTPQRGGGGGVYLRWEGITYDVPDRAAKAKDKDANGRPRTTKRILHGIFGSV